MLTPIKIFALSQLNYKFLIKAYVSDIFLAFWAFSFFFYLLLSIKRSVSPCMYLYNSSYQQKFLTLHLEVWFLNVNFCQCQKLVEKIIWKYDGTNKLKSVGLTAQIICNPPWFQSFWHPCWLMRTRNWHSGSDSMTSDNHGGLHGQTTLPLHTRTGSKGNQTTLLMAPTCAITP